MYLCGKKKDKLYLWSKNCGKVFYHLFSSVINLMGGGRVQFIDNLCLLEEDVLNKTFI